MGSIRANGGTSPLQQPIAPKKGESGQKKVAESQAKTPTSNTKNTVQVNTAANSKKGFGNEAGLTMEIAKELPKVKGDKNQDDTGQAMDLAMKLVEEFYPDKTDVAAKRLGKDFAKIESELQEIVNLLPDKKALAKFKEGVKKLTTGPGC